MTFTSGQTLTGVQQEAVSNPPGCVVRRAAAQSIPNNANTLITWDTEEFDNDQMFAPSSTTVTVKTAGLYVVTANVAFGAATGVRYLNILVNGVTVAGTSTPAATPARLSASLARLCTVGDAITVQVFQNNGAAQNVEGPGDLNARLSVIRVTGT